MSCRITGVVLRQWRECREVLVAALAETGKPCITVGCLVVSVTKPPEGSESCLRLLRGMASLWDSPAREDKGAIAATQAVTAAVLRLLAAARKHHEPVEAAALERLTRHNLMRPWFQRLQRRTTAAGPWMAAELRAVRLGVLAVWYGQGRQSNSVSSAKRLREYRAARAAVVRATWRERLLEGRRRYGPGFCSTAVLHLAWRFHAAVWRRRARVFDWEDGVGELSVEVVGRARAAALRLPATQAWNEASRAARFLTIEVEAGDLERRIRAGVVCWHSRARAACCTGCRCAWHKVLASRRRSVAIPPGAVEVFAAASPSKKRANWCLQRAEGKAAMASFLGSSGPRIEEEQWWGRRAQARRTEPQSAEAAGAQEAAPRGRKRASQQEGVRGTTKRKATGVQRHLHLLSETETRVAGTLLLRKVYLVNPKRGSDGSWLPACLQRDDFEETWWRGGGFAGAGEAWAVRHGFAEVSTTGHRRAGPGPAAVRSPGRLRRQARRSWDDFAEQRAVSSAESLRRSAASEAVAAALRDAPVLDAPLPASWVGSSAIGRR